MSNYTLAEIDGLTRSSGQPPAVNQIDWGPALFDAATLAGHAERGMYLLGRW